MNNKYGFTLIELLVVVLIIGILAAVALPQYTKSVEKSRAAEALIIVKAIASANERYFLENQAYTNDLANLDIDVPGTPSTLVQGPTYGYNRKQTKYFDFAARIPVTTTVPHSAFGTRLPLGSTYVILYNTDKSFYCSAQAVDTKKTCLALGGIVVAIENCNGAGAVACYRIPA